jgi:hypothetical protein
VGVNRYGGEQVCVASGVRRDEPYDIGGFARWAFHPRFGVELSAYRQGRDSNCGAEYHATVVSAGMVLGWF